MHLTLTEFVYFALSSAGALVLLFIIISRTARAYAEARSEARRVVCRLCLHAFECPGSEKIVDCERCGASNERGRNRRLG